MRLLLEEHGLAWEDAWHVTTSTLNYTNHTLLPEALETWPVELMERLLPRHMQIIYLINWMHLEEQGRHGRHDAAHLAAVSLIDENHGRRVRMGHLAFLGARRVNGVSALHTDLMRSTVFQDLHALDPDSIVNKTNGITFRRWLHSANPGLTRLAVEAVGERVLDDPRRCAALEAFAEDAAFVKRFAAMRRGRKEALAAIVADRIGHRRSIPTALFDVQIKRIHEYKRQLLNVLETVALYQAIQAEPHRDWTPRVKIFAGKAAPSYAQAKLIIKLASDVAKAVNDDPEVGGPPQGRVPAELLGEPRRGDHPGRRPLRADLHRRHGGVGHRQHEVRAQRRADGRHARRRQYRDPRPCRGRQHLHLRPRRRRGAGAPAEPDSRARRDRGLAAARRRPRHDRARAGSRRRSRAASGRSSTTCATATSTCSPPISTITGGRSARSTPPGATRPRWWRTAILNTARMAGSPPTARCANTRRRSGRVRAD